MTALDVSFPVVIVVDGEAQPAGSKTSWVPKGKDGKPIERAGGGIIVNTADANKKAKPWQRDVAAAASVQYDGPLLLGPLRVELIFYRPRLKGHFGSGRNAEVLKDSAPAYPTSRPDALKLARGVEDALTGIVWRDDAQIVDEMIGKRWGKPRCEIKVWPTEHETVGDLVRDGVVEPPRPVDDAQLSLAL
jgi:Holliday junction resolvase RusA-like endonuclease